MDRTLAAAYEDNLTEKTLSHGLAVAVVAFTFILIFAYVDVHILMLDNTFGWRVLGLAGFAVFIASSFIPSARPWANVLYLTAIVCVLLMMLGITHLIFSDPSMELSQVLAVVLGNITVWLSLPYVGAGIKRQLAPPSGLLLLGFALGMAIEGRTTYWEYLLALLMVGAFSGIALYTQAKSEYRQFYYLWQLNANNAKLEAQAKALEMANADLGSFNFSISHDLRAPVRTARSFAQLLERDLKDGRHDRIQSHLHYIMGSLEKMNELIEALLSFSSYGSKQVQKEIIDMHSLARQVWGQLEVEVGAQAARLEIEEMPAVEGDRVLIGQVLHNLLSNAVKYSSKVPKPEVRVGSIGTGNESETVFFVRDNGAGFKPEMAPKLFNVFKRLHTEEAFPGTGIGLAIVKRIIQHHDGRVWAEAKEGEGACFYFALPRKRA